MQLYFAGTNHNNPYHRSMLRDWLNRVSSREEGPPEFIAVEADSAQFREIESNQRPRFHGIASERWGDASADDLRLLADSLLFEADSHRECDSQTLRDAPVIWLDEGDPRDATTFAMNRIDSIESMVANFPHPRAADVGLAERVAYACRVIDDRERGEVRLGRDMKFANRIYADFNEREEGWGIVVVGKNHMIANACTMIVLLTNVGHRCLPDVFP